MTNEEIKSEKRKIPFQIIGSIIAATGVFMINWNYNHTAVFVLRISSFLILGWICVFGLVSTLIDLPNMKRQLMLDEFLKDTNE